MFFIGIYFSDCSIRVYLLICLWLSVIGEIRTELESEWAQIIIKTKKAFMQHLSRTNCCEEGEE